MEVRKQIRRNGRMEGQKNRGKKGNKYGEMEGLKDRRIDGIRVGHLILRALAI